MGIAITRHGDRLLLRAAVVTASLIASLIRTFSGTTNCRLWPSLAKSTKGSTKGRLTPLQRPPRDGEETPNSEVKAWRTSCRRICLALQQLLMPTDGFNGFQG